MRGRTANPYAQLGGSVAGMMSALAGTSATRNKGFAEGASQQSDVNLNNVNIAQIMEELSRGRAADAFSPDQLSMAGGATQPDINALRSFDESNGANYGATPMPAGVMGPGQLMNDRPDFLSPKDIHMIRNADQAKALQMMSGQPTSAEDLMKLLSGASEQDMRLNMQSSVDTSNPDAVRTIMSALEGGADPAQAGNLAADKFAYGKDQDVISSDLAERKFEEIKFKNRQPKGGERISVSPDGEVNIERGNLSSVPKGAKTSLFKDVVAGQQTLDAINQIDSLYEPEFLTYKGSAKDKWGDFLNKLDPDQRSQFSSRRSAFISAANKEFLRFRKWATGVAGGEKEMAEIKRATFSEDDSPQDFEAKIALGRSLQRRLNARAKAALAVGIDNQKQFEGYIKANPLEGVPTLQMRGDQLTSMGYSEDQAEAILKDEGYM